MGDYTLDKILIISDSKQNQINGVSITYNNIIKELHKLDFVVRLITPDSSLYKFKTKSLPGYPEIDIVMNPYDIKAELDFCMSAGWYIHIATECSLGLYARLYLAKHNYPFTTCYHTRFPEFIESKTKIPARFFYPFYRWFHNKASNIMVPTIGMKLILQQKGFKNVSIWTRGVDTDLYNPSRKCDVIEPYILCVSRVSCEKGLDDFCKLPYPRKVLIGDGPYLNTLKIKYPDVEFVGEKTGIGLAHWYASAEAFVFPSRTDTFGIVLLEAIASGIPVITYPEPGPLEVIKNNVNGIITDNLSLGLKELSCINKENVIRSSLAWTWKRSAQNFVNIIGL